MPARSTDPHDYQDVPRPVAVLARDIPDAHTTPWHSHKRAQLVYAASGVMVVETRACTWVIPPQRAVWVPSRVEHETRTMGLVAMRTIYVAPRVARHVLRECCAINVSPLLRELILRAAQAPLLYDRNGADGRLMKLILDEIRVSRMLPLQLPIPSHPHLAGVCGRILREIHTPTTLARLAGDAGMSKRTAERLFLRETGMTFSRWRQQARLLTALTRLASGQSVKTAAFEAGYSTQSAFTSMFKRSFGTTPGKYFSEAAVPQLTG
jgi:AraC-like DNA-binding protein